MGPLSLRRRREINLGVDVYEIKLGEEFLMSSMFTVAEIALADLALAAYELSTGELRACALEGEASALAEVSRLEARELIHDGTVPETLLTALASVGVRTARSIAAPRSAQPCNPRSTAKATAASASAATPHNIGSGISGSKMMVDVIGPTCPAAQAHAPDRIYSCRSAHA